MELCSIASGSSGNCIYAGTESSHLMIDAGISGKRIEAGLNSIGLKTAEMQALLVTHEHSDHISGLGVVARNMEFQSMPRQRPLRQSKGFPVWESR